MHIFANPVTYIVKIRLMYKCIILLPRSARPIILIVEYYLEIYFLIENCPPLVDPENGKVFIFSNGEVALFICDPSYVIMGNPYLRCVNGAWSSIPPKCQLA